MKTWTLTRTKDGRFCGEHQARDAAGALDAMANRLGFGSFDALPEPRPEFTVKEKVREIGTED